jgi:Domain of unknown function (DUF6980)
MGGMTKHCCDQMTEAVNHRCAQHPDPFDCPDNLIHYSEMPSAYGIIIHDGGSSTLKIYYCPWCGAKLADEDPPPNS